MSRILVCEDSATQALHLQLVLQSAGHEVVVANDGQEGFELLASSSFDAVLSDIKMPRVTGLELCSKIRSEIGNASIPIILLTTLNEIDVMAQGRRRGATAYMVKPVLPDELLNRLNRLLTAHPCDGGANAKSAVPSAAAVQDDAWSGTRMMPSPNGGELFELTSRILTLSKEAGIACDEPDVVDKLMDIAEIAHQAQSLISDILPYP